MPVTAASQVDSTSPTADTDPADGSQQTLSVSRALGLANTLLNDLVVTVVGEVSELSDKAGYKAIYFSLSDENSTMPCLMWRNYFRSADIKLKSGMLVEVKGMFTVYAAKGRMNFDVRSIKLAGEGDLRCRVADLAKRLEAEGLMAQFKKRPLPVFPEVVAVVTSPHGKAIHDVLRTFKRRFPLTEVLICGVVVEGAAAVDSIIEGLRIAEDSRAEVILLVRGGGSYEDLMPFNDERLVRQIAALTKPVVSGIGHEPDNHIADMVADLRASTPTAAAEAVVPAHTELASALEHISAMLARTLTNRIAEAKIRYHGLAERTIFTDSAKMFATPSLMLDGVAERLHRAIPKRLEMDKARQNSYRAQLLSISRSLLAAYVHSTTLQRARLESASPLTVLGRGYSIVYDANSKIVDSVEKVGLGSTLDIHTKDGVIGVEVKTISALGNATLDQR